MENFKCSYTDLVLIKKLKPHPKNPNKHTEDQIERLAKIIEFQGQRLPVIISKLSGFIVAGHGRVQALKKLGYKQVAVDYQDFDNEDQEYTFIVSDNAISEWSHLDLSQINLELENIGPIDIDLLGIKDFTVEPLEKLEPGCDEDDVPEVKESITKRGDVWVLGNHRVMCGDSTMIDDVEKLMKGEKADMVFTDPPYNTGMSPKKNAVSTWLSHMFDDDYSKDEWGKFLLDVANNYWLISKDSSAHYVCLNWKRSHELVIAYSQTGFKFSNLIVWDKVVHGLGSDYKYTHEYIHVFKKGKPEINSHQGDDAEYRDIWHIQRKMGKDEDHATKKPIELVDRAIRHASKAGGLVVDLFNGSGSTLIACEKTNRKCYGMELDEHYCDVIINRWQKYTGKEAILESNGKTYNQLLSLNK